MYLNNNIPVLLYNPFHFARCRKILAGAIVVSIVQNKLVIGTLQWMNPHFNQDSHRTYEQEPNDQQQNISF